MFRNKTVFIVGAGGGWQVGMPLGAKLRDIIKENLRMKGDAFHPVAGNNTIKEAITLHVQHNSMPREQYNLYRHAANEVADGMEHARSIDNFLDFHSSNENIVKMGKIGIAASILQSERESKIKISGNGTIEIDFLKDIPWYNTFCQMLVDGLKDIQHIFDNISIITFNYDRCIEHYIYRWIARHSLLPHGHVASIMANLNVFHVYGQVGSLDWQHTADIKAHYGIEPSPQLLLDLSEGIQTFTEQKQDARLIEQIHRSIAEAETIVSLGFSFGKQNMDLMNVSGYQGPKASTKQIIGTAFGVSDSAQKIVKQKFNEIFRGMTTQIDLYPDSCEKLLEDNWALLTA